MTIARHFLITPLLWIATNVVAEDKIALPTGAAPAPKAQRSPTDFRDEYLCARAIMGPGEIAGKSFGKLMQRVTDNVIFMPVTRGRDHGFYLVTEAKGAKFYMLDPNQGQKMIGDDWYDYDFKFEDPISQQPYGLSLTTMTGVYNSHGVTKDKLADFLAKANTPTGTDARSADAQNDVIKNLIESLAALPDRMVPQTQVELAALNRADVDALKARTDEVICTCTNLRGSPELQAAIEGFKKNSRIMPYTSEKCGPNAPPAVTGVRSF